MTTSTSDDRHHYFATVYRAFLTTLGVHITTTPLPADDVARWDPPRRTLHIRPTATIEDQVWVMRDFVKIHLHRDTTISDARPAPLALVS